MPRDLSPFLEADYGGPDEIHERITHLVEVVGGQGKAAEIAGVSRASIDNWRKPGAKVPFDGMLKLAQAAGISLDWMATGDEAYIDSRSENSPRLMQTWAGSFALVPVYEAEAGAGPGLVPVSERTSGALAFREEWLRRVGVSEASSGLVTAVGDSMAPTIPDGATMLVDMSAREIRSGYIYVLSQEGAVLVKRLQVKIDGSVILISDNPLYENEVIDAAMVDQLNVAGRVVWVGTSV